MLLLRRIEKKHYNLVKFYRFDVEVIELIEKRDIKKL